jgi:hypothetical protein
MSAETPWDRTSGPIHGWFELTYASYQVLPRVLMQSMPVEWQHRMVACLEEMRAAFRHVEQPESYDVSPCRWVAPQDLSGDQMRLLGITRDLMDEDDEDSDFVYHDHNGDELDAHRESVAFPVKDTLPGYRHGFVEPAEPTEVTR